MLDRQKTQFEIVYFLLNTLNHLLYADRWNCYCEKFKVGHCQICKIPPMFPDFERIIDKNMFNMEVLNKHYDELTK